METDKKKESRFTGDGNVSASVGSLKVGDIQAESGKRRKLTIKKVQRP